MSILHFAGHANGNPAQLVLEDQKVSPTFFAPSSALLSSGHPLIFLNGCRAGHVSDTSPAFLANFVKMLLASKCTAVVAPMIKVQSPAACKAATTCYDAVANNSVGEAVRQIRSLAMDSRIPEDHRATYLSYLAFAPPTLKLAIAH